jgi:nitrate/nitrite transport system substrate-binding protein
MTTQDTRPAARSGRPELEEVRIGFMPLTDCAPVIMARELGFDRRHGIRIVPSRESSWAAVRDKLCSGELDLAHALYGLVYGVQLGVGAAARDMAVLMTLNRNGQGLSLSRRLADAGVRDLETLARHLRRESRLHTFAQTFPTGTHAMWLYYWLASAGIHPFADLRSIVVPPPQMVAHARAGHMDGFSVGEPWNHLGIIDGVSVHAASSQDVWPDHPEKVIGTTARFAQENPDTCRAVIMALLEACRWIDASPANRQRMAETIAARPFVDTAVDVIAERIMGCYRDGLGRTWEDPRHLRFFDDGAVNFPYLSDGMWFMTQHKRWGLLKAHPDYAAVAARVQRIDLYADAASALGIALPASPLRSSRLIDGVVWDGRDPAAYADGFAVHT